MPNEFSDYGEVLKKRLAQHKALARKVISHSGEKGRILEGTVRSVLREILPQRFRIGTGFITNSAGLQSTQQDIVIYDDQDNTPIFLDGDVGVFPIECVYGMIEVKARVSGAEIRKFADSVSEIRGMAKTAKYYTKFQRLQAEGTDSTSRARIVRGRPTKSSLAPRSFLLAYEADTRKWETFERHLEDACLGNRYIAHGVLVLDRNWFCYQKSFTSPPTFIKKPGDAFTNFHLKLLGGLQSIAMKPAFLKRYFGEILGDDE